MDKFILIPNFIRFTSLPIASEIFQKDDAGEEKAYEMPMMRVSRLQRQPL